MNDPVFPVGSRIEALVTGSSKTGDRIECGKQYTVVGVDNGGWPVLDTDTHGVSGWSRSSFTLVSLPASDQLRVIPASEVTTEHEVLYEGEWVPVIESDARTFDVPPGDMARRYVMRGPRLWAVRPKPAPPQKPSLRKAMLDRKWGEPVDTYNRWPLIVDALLQVVEAHFDEHANEIESEVNSYVTDNRHGYEVVAAIRSILFGSEGTKS